MNKTIAIASDHAGFELKEVLKQEIRSIGFDVNDLGPNHGQAVDYPDYANTLSEWIKSNKDGKGVLICGSGVGMCIAANRHRDVRAALCHNGLTAVLARKHNNANVLCLGARLVGTDVAKDCIRHFLTTEFEGGRHEGRVAKLSQKFKRKP
jgi:ribose 5-phosphate isomerase B